MGGFHSCYCNTDPKVTVRENPGLSKEQNTVILISWCAARLPSKYIDESDWQRVEELIAIQGTKWSVSEYPSLTGHLDYSLYGSGNVAEEGAGENRKIRRELNAISWAIHSSCNYKLIAAADLCWVCARIGLTAVRPGWERRRDTTAQCWTVCYWLRDSGVGK